MDQLGATPHPTPILRAVPAMQQAPVLVSRGLLDAAAWLQKKRTWEAGEIRSAHKPREGEGEAGASPDARTLVCDVLPETGPTVLPGFGSVALMENTLFAALKNDARLHIPSYNQFVEATFPALLTTVAPVVSLLRNDAKEDYLVLVFNVVGARVHPVPSVASALFEVQPQDQAMVGHGHGHGHGPGPFEDPSVWPPPWATPNLRQAQEHKKNYCAPIGLDLQLRVYTGASVSEFLRMPSLSAFKIGAARGGRGARPLAGLPPLANMVLRDLPAGSMPVLMRSSLCALRDAGLHPGVAPACAVAPDHPGGTFVVAGTQKVVMTRPVSAALATWSVRAGKGGVSWEAVIFSGACVGGVPPDTGPGGTGTSSKVALCLHVLGYPNCKPLAGEGAAALPAVLLLQHPYLAHRDGAGADPGSAATRSAAGFGFAEAAAAVAAAAHRDTEASTLSVPFTLVLRALGVATPAERLALVGGTSPDPWLAWVMDTTEALDACVPLVGLAALTSKEAAPRVEAALAAWRFDTEAAAAYGVPPVRGAWSSDVEAAVAALGVFRAGFGPRPGAGAGAGAGAGGALGRAAAEADARRLAVAAGHAWAQFQLLPHVGTPARAGVGLPPGTPPSTPAVLQATKASTLAVGAAALLGAVVRTLGPARLAPADVATSMDSMTHKRVENFATYATATMYAETLPGLLQRELGSTEETWHLSKALPQAKLRLLMALQAAMATGSAGGTSARPPTAAASTPEDAVPAPAEVFAAVRGLLHHGDRHLDLGVHLSEALKRDNWTSVTNRDGSLVTGLVAHRNPMNAQALVSQLDTITSSCDHGREDSRKVDVSTMFMICPVHTPDSASGGRTVHAATGAILSLGRPAPDVGAVLAAAGVALAPVGLAATAPGGVLATRHLFVNGHAIGILADDDAVDAAEAAITTAIAAAGPGWAHDMDLGRPRVADPLYGLPALEHPRAVATGLTLHTDAGRLMAAMVPLGRNGVLDAGGVGPTLAAVGAVLTLAAQVATGWSAAVRTGLAATGAAPGGDPDATAAVVATLTQWANAQGSVPGVPACLGPGAWVPGRRCPVLTKAALAAGAAAALGAPLALATAGAGPGGVPVLVFKGAFGLDAAHVSPSLRAPPMPTGTHAPPFAGSVMSDAVLRVPGQASNQSCRAAYVAAHGSQFVGPMGADLYGPVGKRPLATPTAWRPLVLGASTRAGTTSGAAAANMTAVSTLLTNLAHAALRAVHQEPPGSGPGSVSSATTALFALAVAIVTSSTPRELEAVLPPLAPGPVWVTRRHLDLAAARGAHFTVPGAAYDGPVEEVADYDAYGDMEDLYGDTEDGGGGDGPGAAPGPQAVALAAALAGAENAEWVSVRHTLNPVPELDMTATRRVIQVVHNIRAAVGTCWGSRPKASKASKPASKPASEPAFDWGDDSGGSDLDADADADADSDSDFEPEPWPEPELPFLVRNWIARRADEERDGLGSSVWFPTPRSATVAGMPVVVAITSRRRNTEDALVMSASAVDAGMLLCEQSKQVVVPLDATVPYLGPGVVFWGAGGAGRVLPAKFRATGTPTYTWRVLGLVTDTDPRWDPAAGAPPGPALSLPLPLVRMLGPGGRARSRPEPWVATRGVIPKGCAVEQGHLLVATTLVKVTRAAVLFLVPGGPEPTDAEIVAGVQRLEKLGVGASLGAGPGGGAVAVLAPVEITLEHEFVTAAAGFSGAVTSVVLTPEGGPARNATLTVVVSQTQRPAVGSKFDTTCGQKGVVGELQPMASLPFVAATGMVPQVYIDTHGFLTRMMVVQLLEMVYSTWTLQGGLGDLDNTWDRAPGGVMAMPGVGAGRNAWPVPPTCLAAVNLSEPPRPSLFLPQAPTVTPAPTPAQPRPRLRDGGVGVGVGSGSDSSSSMPARGSWASCLAYLRGAGRQPPSPVTHPSLRSGQVAMVEPLAAIAGADTPSVNFAQPMAVGVQQFMIMKQLVSAVAHVRNEGPVAVDTRQAPGGAKRKGGLRFGCMEYDCVKDVGTTVLLKQQLNSDKHRQKLPICLACGLTQTKPVVVDIRCAGCGSSGTGAFGVAFVPFTFVSIIAALATVGVSVHLKCTHSLPREELPRVGVDGTPASIDIQYVDISSIECVNREEAP